MRINSSPGSRSTCSMETFPKHQSPGSQCNPLSLSEEFGSLPTLGCKRLGAPVHPHPHIQFAASILSDRLSRVLYKRPTRLKVTCVYYLLLIDVSVILFKFLSIPDFHKKVAYFLVCTPSHRIGCVYCLPRKEIRHGGPKTAGARVTDLISSSL